MVPDSRMWLNGSSIASMVAGFSASAAISSNSGWRAFAASMVAGLRSMPTPRAGFSAASVSPTPQPISSTVAPSGIRKRR